ncbi:MAG TPA: thioredoxin family protein [Candidatus Limnocylindrales bacterium]|nr:thioredoxin family protein [Candidatus Limnocylindrales bacterium]
MLHVKVLGSGCANCQRLEAETRAALNDAGIPFELTKVTDYAEIAGYGVLSTPALVLDEKVVAAGRIPSRSRIVELVQQNSAS